METNWVEQADCGSRVCAILPSHAAACACVLALSSGMKQKCTRDVTWSTYPTAVVGKSSSKLLTTRSKTIPVCLAGSEFLTLWIVIPEVMTKGFAEGHAGFYTR